MKYQVVVQINITMDIEANSEEEAEQLALDSWTSDDAAASESVYVAEIFKVL